MNPDSPVPLAEIFLQASFLIPVGVMLVLLLVSALVSGSEVAFFSLGPADLERLREEEHPRSKIILKLLESPDFEQGPRNLLATILVLNNAVNIIIILISTLVVEQILPAETTSPTVSFAINIVGVTSLIVLFGEVIPKVYATNYGLQIAGVMAQPLLSSQKVLYILWKPLVAMGSAIEKRLRPARNENISVEDLEHALELTDSDERSADEKKIYEGILSFGSKDVRQIMTPRTDVSAVPASLPWSKLIEEVLDNSFSRIPVYEDSLDNIAGVLYIKDLLPYIDHAEFNWNVVIRKPFFVPENKKIDDLLRDFQSRKMHMAVVVDEYGGTSGIVTLEDVLEEIVGEITDEFDDDDLNYSRIDEHTCLFEGKTALIDVYRVMDIQGEPFEEAKGDSETLGGFVVELAGKIPLKGERYTFDRYTFTVEASDRRRVKRVKLSIEPDDKTTD